MQSVIMTKKPPTPADALHHVVEDLVPVLRGGDLEDDDHGPADAVPVVAGGVLGWGKVEAVLGDLDAHLGKDEDEEEEDKGEVKQVLQRRVRLLHDALHRLPVTEDGEHAEHSKRLQRREDGDAAREDGVQQSEDDDDEVAHKVAVREVLQLDGHEAEQKHRWQNTRRTPR